MLINQLGNTSYTRGSKELLLPIIIACALFLITGCGNRNNLSTEKLSDYLPLQIGKYITYRVDSTVFTQYGRQMEVHAYQVKCQIDTTFIDNLGRTSYRIIRLERDSGGILPWKNAGSFYISPATSQIEWVENNLRQVKLQMPVTLQNKWKGNRFLSTNPLNPPYDFSNDDNIQDWDFTYALPASNFQFRDKLYTEVISVMQIDKSFNVPITLPASFAFKNYAVDKFAKGIGLIYKEWECWEYQPNTSGTGSPYRIGFGIKQWMIDHN